MCITDQHISTHNHPEPREPPTIAVFEPRLFEEATAIAHQLIAGNSITIDLSKMDVDLAQRSIDFLNGTVEMIDGNQERISEFVFILTPPNVKVSRPTAQTKALPPVEPETRDRAWWMGLASVLCGGV